MSDDNIEQPEALLQPGPAALPDKAASEPPARDDDNSAQSTPLLQTSKTFPGSSASTQEYKLKDIQWQDPETQRLRDVKIVTQNENGPCPLIALANALVLRGDLSIAGDRTTISAAELVGMLGDQLFGDGAAQDERTALSSDDVQVILRLLPTLSTGLDVDLQFSHVYDFAASPATQLFKAFNVDLVHGWVVDPERERPVADVLMRECRNSYEGAVEFIFAADELDGVVGKQKGSGQALTERQQVMVRGARAVNQWLDRSATQLTEFGLQSLGTLLPARHLAVLFRNNHFSTLFKRGCGELFLLCTDDSMAGDQRVVWESLRDVHQTTSEFLDS
ncbi:hypothetical protein EC988_004449, partial [Linderina pennispora]